MVSTKQLLMTVLYSILVGVGVKQQHVKVALMLGPAVLATWASACSLDWKSPKDASADAPSDYVPDWLDVVQGDCPSGQVACGSECVFILSDHDHCGRCDRACQPFETCISGSCVIECPAGRTACDGACVDTDTDVDHCGACGNACEAGFHSTAVCRDGTCSVECLAGWSDEDGDGDCETCTSSGAEEICNGVDEDCDGVVDNGFDCAMGSEVACTTSCSTQGTGICTLTCEPPPASACTPPAESCNGEDDDCNDQCDNGFNCCVGDVEEGGTCGTAGHQERTCLSDCSWGPWDCVDEGECVPGSTEPCGYCGTRTCSAAKTWGGCEGEGVCSPGTSQGCGYCGSQYCQSDCRWSGCSGEGDCSPGATQGCGNCGSRSCQSDCRWGGCSGEGVCSPGATQGCETCGTQTCSSSCAWGACVKPTETCNGVDDNCDGSIDEGFDDAYEPCESCAAARSMGTVADTSASDTITISGQIKNSSDSDWYVIQATDDTDSTADEFDLQIYFTSNPGGLAIDVYRGNCSGSGPPPYGTRICTGVSDCVRWTTDGQWTTSIDVSGAPYDGENPCTSSVSSGNNQCNSETGSWYIRVYRSSGSGACTPYTIVVDNNPASNGPGCANPT
jgi:hypothetical protein